MLSDAIVWRPLSLLAILALGCGPAFSAHGQSAPSAAAERPATLVSLDVVVTGPQGEPIPGVHASEIHIFEDRKERKILFFRPRERGGPQQGLLRLNEFSNRSKLRLPPPTVVLLDLLNERLLTGTGGGIEIGQALQRLEHSERLSLYLLTRHNELYPVRTLQKAEDDVAESQPPWTRTAPALLDMAMRSVLAMRDFSFVTDGLRFDATVQSLRMLAVRLAAVPGRKNLIWITHGVPIQIRDASGEPFDLAPAVKNLAADLVRSHIGVYAVAQSAQGVGSDLDASADMLRLISSWTGGREYGSDYVENAINDSIRDAHGAYVLAYDRPAKKRPAQYHKLQVTCDRKGTRVLFRQGDLDVADRPLSDREQLTALDSAARAALDSPDIGVKADISSAGSGSHAFRVNIHIDPRDVFLRQGADGRFHSQLDLAIAGYDDDTLRELPPSEQWAISLNEKEYRSGARDDVELAKDITPSQSIRKIRCIVMDRELNATGSVTVPLPARGQGSGR
jgi:VWFA-related protein